MNSPVKIIILTGSGVRHDFMRKAIGLDPDIKIMRTYCEKTDKLLPSVISSSDKDNQVQFQHLEARQLSELDFFSHFNELTPDYSNPVKIHFSEVNSLKCFDEINELKPDLLVAYGCSLIKDPLLSAFKGKFINVHLGISPYYRGTGTNFWPLVNGEPEFVGATFMHIDAGVDTGEIIHQIRARIFADDTPHQIGNRLISDVARTYIRCIKGFDQLNDLEQLPVPNCARYYQRKDFTPESVQRLYANFENGMIDKFLNERIDREKCAPILTNTALSNRG